MMRMGRMGDESGGLFQTLATVCTGCKDKCVGEEEKSRIKE